MFEELNAPQKSFADYLADRRIMVTGAPKSGTHWVADLCRSCGWLVLHLHQPYCKGSVVPAVCVYRHPKNMLISMCRHRGDEVNTGNLAQWMLNYYHGRDLVAVYGEYLGYSTHKGPNVFIINFEDLVAGAPSPDSATKTGSHSDWRDHWNGELEQCWRTIGGTELEQTLTDRGIIN